MGYMNVKEDLKNSEVNRKVFPLCIIYVRLVENRNERYFSTLAGLFFN